MRLLAPAKINLHLRVGPRRDDGFHSLLSWMSTIGLFDILDLQRLPASATQTDAFVLRCDRPDLPCDARNLVTRVARAWMDVMRGEQSPASHFAGVRATLAKRIPMGGGLGGGSSDGATALVGLNRLCKAEWSLARLSELAARFGSDLPFFFFGPSSVCRGRGERVEPIASPRPSTVLLILPDISMPTGPVYKRFDELGLGRDEDLLHEPPWNSWTSLDALNLLPHLVNDLETPAFDLSPQLDELRRQAERQLKRPVRMSGSGSSLFTLYDSAQEAAEAVTRWTQLQGSRILTVPLAPALE